MRKLMFAAISALTTVAENWPAWRGSDGNGICRETQLPLRWSTDKVLEADHFERAIKQITKAAPFTKTDPNGPAVSVSNADARKLPRRRKRGRRSNFTTLSERN